MAVVAKASPPGPFELKSASLSVVALVLRTTDLGALAGAMTALFGATPGVFDHDPVVVDLSQLADDAPVIDFDALTQLLRSHRMLPAAVRGGASLQHEAALAAGLSHAPDDRPVAAAAERLDPRTADAPVEPAAAEPSPEPPAATVAALVIDKPLRSGQQVYAKGGDLIVLAAVNFGAEVIADGNVHVYGPLRGKAVAGAKGRRDARIFSICMEPELLAIAGTYRTTEDPLPAGVWARPAQIRLDGDRLVFEPLA